MILRETETIHAPLEQHDDAALLERIRRGDEAALASLYDRYSRLAYSVMLRVLRHPATAEELVEEIFLDLWRHTERYLSVRGPLGAWLALIARNRAIDALQLRPTREAFADVSLAPSCDPGSTTFSEETRIALAALPRERRKILGMAFFDGLTHSEIAEIVGQASSSIGKELCDTLLALREESPA